MSLAPVLDTPVVKVAASTATTASFTPTVDWHFALVTIGNTGSVSGAGGISNVSWATGGSGTWSLVARANSSFQCGVELWKCQASAATAGTVQAVATSSVEGKGITLSVFTVPGCLQSNPIGNNALTSTGGSINSQAVVPNATGSVLVGGLCTNWDSAHLTTADAATSTLIGQYADPTGESHIAVYSINATVGGVSQAIGSSTTAINNTNALVVEILAAPSVASAPGVFIPPLAPMFWMPSLSSQRLRGDRTLSQDQVVGLSDVGSVADALTSAAAVPFAETAAGTDAMSSAAAVPLAETGSGVDALGTTATRPLADTGTGTEALGTTSALPLAETATGTDALTSTAPVSTAETGSAADAMTISAAVPFAETGTGTEGFSVTATSSLADVGSVVDAMAITVAQALAETGTVTDGLVITAAISLADTVGVADALGIASGSNPSLPESGTATDALTTTAAVPLPGETGAVADALTITVAMPFPETGTGVDALAYAVAEALNAEVATALDALGITAALPLPETAAVTDAMSTAAALGLGETGTVTEGFTISQTGASPQLPDQAHIADALTITATVGTMPETGTVADALRIDKGSGGPIRVVSVQYEADPTTITYEEGP